MERHAVFLSGWKYTNVNSLKYIGKLSSVQMETHIFVKLVIKDLCENKRV